MALRSISLMMLVIWISGCALGSPSIRRDPDEQKVRTFADNYRRARQAEKTVVDAVPSVVLSVPLGVVKPYLPVIIPPRVIKVWVPAHILKENRDIMVGGHWSFVMLDKTRWFIEGEVR